MPRRGWYIPILKYVRRIRKNLPIHNGELHIIIMDLNILYRGSKCKRPLISWWTTPNKLRMLPDVQFVPFRCGLPACKLLSFRLYFYYSLHLTIAVCWNADMSSAKAVCTNTSQLPSAATKQHILCQLISVRHRHACIRREVVYLMNRTSIYIVSRKANPNTQTTVAPLAVRRSRTGLQRIQD